MGESEARLEREIANEQAYVDRAYRILDDYRRRYRERQKDAHASKWRNTPQALTERDALSAHWGDEAQRLENVGDRLVFGRIDDTSGESLYVGRIGLRDHDGEQFLIDWRAPAARPFYQATGAHPQGVRRRRHIQTRLRQVVGIEDELLDAQAPTDGLVFQGEGALMAALTQARDGFMGDIVSTIQREQDEIIRRDGDGLIVLQGGPGTGKTAVALHRAAYLLYAERSRLENSGVLIVGPSQIFLHYIDKVLPSLGETGVVSTTMADLVPGYHASSRESERVREIKGRLVWVDIIARAVRSFERGDEDVKLRVMSTDVFLRASDFAAARARARRSGKRHNEVWESFAIELMNVLAAQLDEANNEHHELEWYFSYIRASKEAQRAINLAWLPVSAGFVLNKLLSNPDFLAKCAPELSAQDRQALMRPANSAWTDADILLLDELEEALGPLPNASTGSRRLGAMRAREEDAARAAIDALDLGGGLVSAQMLAERAREQGSEVTLADRAMRDREWAYGHIIVDEAQELTALAWHCLLRRCPSRSFTVCGDLDQFSGSRALRSWEQILGPANRALVAQTVLTVSYRTPGQILRRAQQYLSDRGLAPAYPLVAAREGVDTYRVTAGSPVAEDLYRKVEEALEEECRDLDTALGAGQGRIAVIASSEWARELAKIEGSKWGQAHGQSLTQRVVYLTAAACKGLEFDVVILVDPTQIGQDRAGDLYVAMTRPTRRLHVVSVGELPPALQLND
ncbi:MAG: AAA family ATPase [Actinomycetaceae bacterium]|nr:AAA family ATPase [Actinomycetaceae bacterium]